MANRGFEWKRLGILAGLIAALLVAGVTFAQQSGDKTLRMAWYLDHHTFGPPFHYSTADWPNYLNIYNLLVRNTPGAADLEPDLAESWEVSDDGLTYTFHLREGVQFHKGYGEFTSEDVVFVFEQLADLEIGQRYAPVVQEEIASVEAVDRYTVRITLNNPFSDFLATIAARPALIYSKAAFEELGIAGMQDTPVGTGAFELVEWVEGERMVFEANDSYFRGRPALDRVVVSVIPEETVTVLSMQQGEIDFAFIRTPQAIRLANSIPDLQVEATPVLGRRSIWFNRTREPFDDIRVVHALSHAIDRETLVGTILSGIGVVSDSMWSAIPEGVFGHTKDVARYEFDPERAQELLAEAGLSDGFEFSLQYRVSDTAIAQALQSMWAEIGIDVTLEELEAAQFYARQQQNNWNTTIQGPTRTTPDEFLTYFHSTNFPNFYGQIDGLIEEQRSAVDPDRRADLLEEIQQDIAGNASVVPIFRPLYVTVSRPGVTGDVPNSHYWLWYWELMDKE